MQEFNPTKFTIDFVSNRQKYMSDPIILKYLEILNIDVLKIKDFMWRETENEIKKLVKLLMKHEGIGHQIYNYIVTKKSVLRHLDPLSREQYKYVTSLETCDSKLIACAGSGKTRCIIERIKFMVDHGFAQKNEIFAITFSKHASKDFHEKIIKHHPDHLNFFRLKNFSTIDSLAKSILCHVKSHKSENVEILSIAFRNYLKTCNDLEIQRVQKIKNIQHLFIDEAQDLNEIQYEIAMLLKEKLGTRIHLIGDPNQNIYQFRRSSSFYLINFSGLFFELTFNYRSTQEIINFSEFIKPIKTSESKSATNKTGPLVQIISDNDCIIHEKLYKFISTYQQDISNIAIICPTRGIGTRNNVGLSVIFNFLKTKNIPFVQLYDESGSRNTNKNFDKSPGHLNIMTYHGTKGLEFDIVFIMDFYQFLFNIKPTEEEHKINQYLMYVACTRAKSLMYLCVYQNVNNGYINHWITQIPEQCYMKNGNINIPKLSYREKTRDSINGITEILNELTDEQLDTIFDHIKITDNYSRKIYQDYSLSIDRKNDEILFGIFCEELFHLQYNLSRRLIPKKLPLIATIIKSKYIVINNEEEYNLLTKYVVKNKLTWEKFETLKYILPNYVQKLIHKYFSKKHELNSFTICTNEFIKIVNSNLPLIRSIYQTYLNPSNYSWNYKKIINDFFYLIVVQYAYEINHYYYIANHGNDKSFLLTNGKELFKEMNHYVVNNFMTCKLTFKENVYYAKLMLMGEIDFIEYFPHSDSENIVEIKCAKEMSLKYYIQLLLYNFCYYYQNNPERLYRNKYKLVNFLTGLEYQFIINITPAAMFNLLNVIAQIGGLYFSNMNLVYDLETSDKIKTLGPYSYLPQIPNSKIFRKDNKYYAELYPEIIEIAIKDYESEMIIVNLLIQPKRRISTLIQTITGINNDMLENKPRLENLKLIMENKMKYFVNCKMMAHNGSSFDNKIMIHYGLINSTTTFLDTLSMVPIHLPALIKLKSKTLSYIYKILFKSSFSAHRAMSDVNALIKIMKYLNISF